MTDRERLMELMDQASMTQADLARLLELSKVSVNRWFRDRADGAVVPVYAIRFMEVFLLLAPAMRRSLLEHYGAWKKPAATEEQPASAETAQAGEPAE